MSRRRPLALGHRGAAGWMPENTEASFAEAEEAGADGFELDVRLSVDDGVVVIHDALLDRTTSASGLIAATPLATICAADASYGRGAELGRMPVPSLASVLQRFAERMTINVELKPDHRIDRLVAATLEVVESCGVLDRIVFSCFDQRALRRLRELSSRARIGVLFVPEDLEHVWRWADKVTAVNVHPHRSVVDEAFVATAHESGLEVWTWTVNEPADICRMIDVGADAIIGDFPDRIVAALDARETVAD